MTTNRSPKKKPTTVDLTDLTLDELDEVSRLMADTEPPVGRITAFAYVGLRRSRPDLTLEAARQLTSRDVVVIESDPEKDDEGPTSAP